MLFRSIAWSAYSPDVATSTGQMAPTCSNGGVQPVRVEPLGSISSQPSVEGPVLFVFEVRDSQLIVVVVALGKRERNAVYKAADKR